MWNMCSTWPPTWAGHGIHSVQPFCYHVYHVQQHYDQLQHVASRSHHRCQEVLLCIKGLHVPRLDTECVSLMESYAWPAEVQPPLNFFSQFLSICPIHLSGGRRAKMWRKVLVFIWLIILCYRRS